MNRLVASSWIMGILGLTLAIGADVQAAKKGGGGAGGLEAYSVVLDCGGKKFTAACDASGKFVIPAAASGECTISLVSSAPPADTADGTSGAAGVVAPRDSATGQASGKRMHKPMLIRVVLDESKILDKTMAADSWSTGMESIVLKEGKHTKTGHVTLLK